MMYLDGRFADPRLPDTEVVLAVVYNHMSRRSISGMRRPSMEVKRPEVSDNKVCLGLRIG
jgi:hypothetical protein